MRELAQRLLILEGPLQGVADNPTAQAMRVFEQLRVALARFAGSDSFASLVRRALALAKADEPALQQVTISANGSLEGLEEVADDPIIVIIAHFLGLLVTFIGEPLTLRLVRDAWPDATLDDSHESTRSIA